MLILRFVPPPQPRPLGAELSMRKHAVWVGRADPNGVRKESPLPLREGGWEMGVGVIPLSLMALGI